MVWYIFDLTGLPEPIQISLTRTFFRSCRRENSGCASHLYVAAQGSQATPATYYLQVVDELPYARLIRQFGGRRCTPLSYSQLVEIKQDGDSRTSAAEVDTSAC